MTDSVGTKHFRILVADDERLILDLYEQILCSTKDIDKSSSMAEGSGESNAFFVPSFELTLCEQAGEAVEAVRASIEEKKPYAVVFLDIQMPPGPDGVWAAESIRELDKEIGIVFVTAFSSIDLVDTAQRVPPPDKLLYLQKPFYPQEIWQFASAMGEKWRIEKQFQAIQAGLESLVEKRTAALGKSNKQLKKEIKNRTNAEKELRLTMEILQKALKETIQAMSLTVETRDPYTAGHQKRVAELAGAIAEDMGFSKDRVEGIRMAGIIHDLGKIAVPAEILSKPGPITKLEFAIIKTHSQVGYDILKSIEFPWPIAQIMLQHHERMDGSGYPMGIKGEDILLESRILAVADVVEAMASHRPYRPALGIDVALEEISKRRGVCYDADVVDVCLKLFDEKKFDFKK